MQPTQSAAEKPVKHRLQIATDIASVLDSVPAKLKVEYEFLVSKNELLQQQLAILKDKIVFLETKLNNLTLISEKTLSLPAGDSAAINAGTPVTSASDVTADTNANDAVVNASSNKTNSANNSAAGTVTSTGIDKKVFKILNVKPTLSPIAAELTATQNSNGLIVYLNTDWAKAALALGVLAILSAFLFKKYRERVFVKMSFVTTQLQATVQETMVDFGGYLKPKLAEPEDTPDAKLQAQVAKEIEA